MIFKKKQKNTNSYNTKNAKTSYSQCGEDLIIQYIFNLRKIYKPSYIDIGANDPFFLNNTAIFYQKGCQGINIEANPNLIKNFQKHRPNDLNLNIGIGETEEELDFYIMNDNTLSSFSRNECDKYIATGKYNIDKIEKIKTTTIQRIINNYNNSIFPDFLSIDAEGLDFEILKTIDYKKNSPKIICVEAAEYSPIGAGEKRSDLINFLKNNNYYEYANTNLNAIMVEKNFWFNFI